jgi:hypothetical protein
MRRGRPLVELAERVKVRCLMCNRKVWQYHTEPVKVEMDGMRAVYGRACPLCLSRFDGSREVVVETVVGSMRVTSS